MPATLLPSATVPERCPELPEAVEPEPAEPGGPWLLILVPAAAWALIDTLRRIHSAPTRSAVAGDLLRRALSLEAITVEALTVEAASR